MKWTVSFYCLFLFFAAGCSKTNEGDILTTSNSNSTNGSGPTASVSAPSRTILTVAHTLTFTATFSGATSVPMTASDVTLNTTGSVSCSKAVSGSGTTTRTISLTSCTGEGTVGITVKAGAASNGNPSSASSASTTATVYNDGGTFTYSSNTSPFNASGSASKNDVAEGDFNEDGYMDVVFAKTGGGASVYINDGAGRFKFPITLVGTETSTKGVVVGDFNNDNHSDIVLINAAGGLSRLWTNDGSASFTSGNALKSCVTTTTTVMAAQKGVAADFNGDGNLDIAFAVESGKNCINKGSGNGSFTYFADTGSAGEDVGDYVLDSNTDDSQDIASGDIDGDGDIDLVVANRSSSQPDRVYTNNGSGVFTAANLQLNGSDEALCDQSIALGDLNKDNRLDIVFGNRDAACAGAGQARFSLQASNGTFPSPTLVTGSPTTSETYSVLLEDLNGDAYLDLVLINRDAVDMVRKWDSTNSTFTQFSGSDTYGPGNSGAGYGAVIHDFNGDGLKDIIMARNSSTSTDHSMIYWGVRTGFVESVSWLANDASNSTNSSAHYDDDPVVTPFIMKDTGNVTMSNLSSIIYDPTRNYYYTVRNNDLKANEINASFTAIRDFTLSGWTTGTGNSGDLEAIVYLGQSSGVSEFAIVNEIGEMYIGTIPTTGTTLTKGNFRKITIDSALASAADKNLGLESVAYDAANDVFYAAREGESSYNRVIYRFPRPSGTADVDLTGSATMSTFIFNTASDISDIFYNATTGTLLVMSDLDSKIYEITKAGILLGQHPLPKGNTPATGMQYEGVCIGPDNRLVVVSEKDTTNTDNTGSLTYFNYQ